MMPSEASAPGTIGAHCFFNGRDLAPSKPFAPGDIISKCLHEIIKGEPKLQMIRDRWTDKSRRQPHVVIRAKEWKAPSIHFAVGHFDLHRDGSNDQAQQPRGLRSLHIWECNRAPAVCCSAWFGVPRVSRLRLR